MGQFIAAVSKMQCLDSLNKFVLNACHSECHSYCCDCEIETDKVDIPESHENVEIKLDGVFDYHKNN